MNEYNSDWINQNRFFVKGSGPQLREVWRPQIVCLCGSTRFGPAFKDASRDETLAGKIVLSVGLLGHLENLNMNGPVKLALDDLHKRKIDLADEVLVLNVGGYVGDSTRSEVLYAYANYKPVRWLEPDKVPDDLKRCTS